MNISWIIHDLVSKWERTGRNWSNFSHTDASPIGLYRENAIAIEGEARDPFGGNVYYVTMQITFHISEFARKERNLHCDVVGAYTLPPNGSLDSFWITRSQRSRRRDKGLCGHESIKIEDAEF